MTEKHNRSLLISLLDEMLRSGGINKVYYIDPEPEIAVPQNGNFSGASRLAVPLEGCHRMVIPAKAEIRQISPVKHTATFMPKGSWNAPDWGLPVKVVTFHFAKETFGFSFVNCTGVGLNERNVLRETINWTSLDGHLIFEMVHRVFEHDPEDLRGIALIQALIGFCLEALMNKVEPEHGKAHATYLKICAYLEEYYASDISRESVAASFKISSNYLSNLFKSQSGASFSSHVNRLRIKRACHLLSKFDLNLDEIAMNCGYHETGYFCRVFKKHQGCTPGEYRSNSH